MIKYIGISLLLSLLASHSLAEWQVDFHSPQEPQNWLRINDSVMGGVSTSVLHFEDGSLLFKGQLSLENNGGFASVRRVGKMSLSSQNGPLTISAKGDGRQYQVRLRTNRTYDGVAYVAMFSTNTGWQNLQFQQSDFVAQYRGRRVNGAPALSFDDVEQIGFMLADKQPGAFRLRVNQLGQKQAL